MEKEEDGGAASEANDAADLRRILSRQHERKAEDARAYYKYIYK